MAKFISDKYIVIHIFEIKTLFCVFVVQYVVVRKKYNKWNENTDFYVNFRTDVERMKQEQKEHKGHFIVTYQVRLYDRHFAWLHETKELYARVVQHFFSVLSKENHLLQLSDFLLLRELETKCIGTKEMKAKGTTPEYPLVDFPKIPLYFRRSAINTAIDLARKQKEDTKVQNPAMTLYKGMYENFTDTSIDLKLFNGEKWVWVTYPFTGRELPNESKRLSPVLMIKKKNAYLNIPVSVEVSDIRTVKERMKTEERFCAVAFPDYDVLAVAVIFSKEGMVLEKKFFRGGKQKEHARKHIKQRLQKSKESRAKQKEHSFETTQIKQQEDNFELIQGKQLKDNFLIKDSNSNLESNVVEMERKENACFYEKIHNLNNYYAHSISRQLVDYCIEKNIKIIVVPNYEGSIDFREKRYLKTDGYRWIGRSIIKNLKYKAFVDGIVVTSVRAIHISDCCSECGAKIRKYNEGHKAGQKYHGGKLFVCPNGHKGNTAENTAKNIGKNFLTFYS